MIKNFLKKIDRKLFPDFYSEKDEYKELLKKYAEDCESLLDVGCGYISPISHFTKHMKYTVGVDGYDKAINTAKERKVHTEDIHMDVRKIGEKFEEKSFDCVVALDLIEHLTKEEGNKLIEDMQRIAKKRIIIFTPNGFVDQEGYDDNVLQIHKSGWSDKEMRAKGFKIIGVNGWKFLRTTEARLKWKPEMLWQRISYLTQKLTRRNTKFAYQIFCVKEI